MLLAWRKSFPFQSAKVASSKRLNLTLYPRSFISSVLKIKRNISILKENQNWKFYFCKYSKASWYTVSIYSDLGFTDLHTANLQHTKLKLHDFQNKLFFFSGPKKRTTRSLTVIELLNFIVKQISKRPSIYYVSIRTGYTYGSFCQRSVLYSIFMLT